MDSCTSMNLYVFLVSSPSHIITSKATFVWQTVKVDDAKPPFAIEFLNSNRNISFHLRPAKVWGGGGVLRIFIC